MSDILPDMKCDAVNVRIMTEADVSSVANIEKQCFSEPWSENAFLAATKDDNYIFMVAECNAQIVGMAGIIKSFDEGDVTNVATHPDMRGRGVARKVLSTLFEEALSQGITSLTLEVRQHNVSAIKLYESLGFICEGKRPGFYENPKEDALIYWRR